MDRGYIDKYINNVDVLIYIIGHSQSRLIGYGFLIAVIPQLDHEEICIVKSASQISQMMKNVVDNSVVKDFL